MTTATATVEKGGIGVYEWNPLTFMLSWDETSAAIFAADRPGETPAETWVRRVHPDDQHRVLRTFAEFGRAEDLFRLVLDDGSVRHILSRATHVTKSPDGEPMKVHGVLLDVTTMQQSGARLTSMLDSISEGFCTVDREYRFTYLNRRAEMVMGMDADALVGLDIWQVFPHMVGTAFEAAYRRVMEDGASEAFEEYYPQPLDKWIEVRAQPSEDGMVIYFQDVSDRRARQDERERLLASERQSRMEADAARRAAERAQQELAHQAAHDSLTGLANRSEFERIAAQRLGDLAAPTTALFLDLDRFKLVNDSLGHAAGDALLVEIGARLRRVLRGEDMAARIGGDEFVILLVGPSTGEAQVVAERLLEEVREPVVVGDYTVSTSVSIGLAEASTGTTVVTLLRDADAALYRAKDAGRDRLAWFDTQAHDDLLERVAIERDLRAALADDGIGLHYQPIYAVDDQRLIGVEALARWHHRDRGHIPPCVFIPLAEDAGLIKQLGANVIRAASRQAARWSDLPDFTVWVNVSGRQLDTPGVAGEILRELAEAGIAPCRFGVEVTESVLSDETVAVRELVELSDAGVAIAIDDFGTGYSSFARLATLPISVLKIDQSFVADIERRDGRALVDVILNVARVLGLRTIAEGIETRRQLELLRDAGADSAAGYLLGRPAPAQALRVRPEIHESHD